MVYSYVHMYHTVWRDNSIVYNGTRPQWRMPKSQVMDARPTRVYPQATSGLNSLSACSKWNDKHIYSIFDSGQTITLNQQTTTRVWVWDPVWAANGGRKQHHHKCQQLESTTTTTGEFYKRNRNYTLTYTSK